MPLKPGKSQNKPSKNIEELHNGLNHARNAAKFGKRGRG